MPELSDFPSIDINYFDIKEVRKSESICLKKLNYKLNIFSSYHILCNLLNLGIIFEDEVHDKMNYLNIFTYSKKLLKRFVCDNISTNFNPMQIALSVVYCTRSRFNLSQKRMNVLLDFYGYKEDYFSVCLNYLKEINIDEVKSSSLAPIKKGKSITTKIIINVQDKIKNTNNININPFSQAVIIPSTQINTQNNENIATDDTKTNNFKKIEEIKINYKYQPKNVSKSYNEVKTNKISTSTNSSNGKIKPTVKKRVTNIKLPEIDGEKKPKKENKSESKFKTTLSLYNLITKND
jgi:hypothetical protein